jgi:hypothetical protein
VVCCVPLASQPSPIALNEDDAKNDDDDEALHLEDGRCAAHL